MRKNKYRNKTVVVDGIAFDSKKEARRFQELKLLESSGAICSLQRQVKFVLIPAQYEPTGERYTKGKKKGCMKPGKLLERECTYIADFQYYDIEKAALVVEDTKGVRTDKYIIKRKLMLYMHGIKIKEV